MSKAAILRRQCIRAKRTLMRRWPNVYFEECFEDSNDEWDVLNGTPWYWFDCGQGEADCRLAIEELQHVRFAEETDWGRLAKEMEIRQRHGGIL